MCVHVCGARNKWRTLPRERSTDTEKLRTCLLEEHSHCAPTRDRLGDNASTDFDLFCYVEVDE